VSVQKLVWEALFMEASANKISKVEELLEADLRFEQLKNEALRSGDWSECAPALSAWSAAQQAAHLAGERIEDLLRLRPHVA